MNVNAVTRYTAVAAFASALMISASAAFAADYNCTRYVNGKSTGGHVRVSASSETEAIQLALERYRNKLKLKVDSVKCKRALL